MFYWPTATEFEKFMLTLIILCALGIVALIAIVGCALYFLAKGIIAFAAFFI